MDPTLGPGGDFVLEMTPPLSDLLLDHNRYQANLPIWDQYLIWRYTLGSGTITRRLVGLPSSDNDIYWTYNFFSSYNTKHYGVGNIGYPYQNYRQYFEDPKQYITSRDRAKIADDIIIQFAKDLERIILNSPPTTGEINVYKVSAPYPDLPLNEPIETEFEDDFAVKQKPFNSTTYDPQFNFLPFLGDQGCCLYKITIPSCSRVLAISPLLHAYPHEREILLPFGSEFLIEKSDAAILNVIPTANQNFVKVQNSPLVIGEVFRINPQSCSVIEQRPMRLFEATLNTPYRSCF